MNSDGQIVFEVTADGRHAIADIKEITRAVQTESNKWDKAAKESTDGISNNFGGMLKKIVAGFSAVKIGQALLRIGKDALNAASDLEEVQNVVDVTFGDGAAKIESWSKTAGAQFGLTETQAKKFASTMGAMMKSSGLAGDQIVNMSTDLAGLAADMASFYNLDFDTAFQKIRSGISGETEPLKQLGINMSVANLNAYALQKGLSKTFEQMTQGEQTMLRYQYMMSATADAQGDFSRTSDGYANSLRQLETNIESVKTKLGSVLIPAMRDAIGFVNEFLDRFTGNRDRTVLDDFADINLNTAAKMQEIETTTTKTQELLDLLDKVYGKGDNGEDGAETGKVVAGLGVKSDEARAYLESLGFTTDEINKKQETWLETCRRLVKTIPGLSEIINTETGEVKGGRAAVEEYVNAWADGQRRLALLNAQAQKKAALAEKYSQLPGLEVDKMLWEDRLKKSKAQLEGLMKQYGLSGDADSLNAFNPGSAWATERGLSYEQSKLLSDEQKYYAAVKASAASATAEFKKQSDAYNEAVKIVEDGEKVIKDTYGEIEETTDASAKFWTDNAEKAKTAVADLSDAMTKLDDYVTGVHDAVTKAVDSTVSGFTKVKSPMQDLQEQINELTLAYSNGEIEQDEYQKKTAQLTRQMDEQGLTAKGMIDNLKSQAAFMSEYMRLLDEAKSRGVSADVLAELSDGSTESADRLKALSEASDEEIADINELYSTVQHNKKQLADTLTAQQLSADETYKTLAQSAKEAVAALDLGQEAADNAGKTVSGMAQGISDHVSEVQTAVDSILLQLNRLNGFGINIDFGGFGAIKFKTSTGKTEGKTDGSGRMGIDYIPRDDYIVRAHEGETLLNAEEARIWRNIKAGGFSTDDISALSGALGDTIKPGGDVFLDGRKVGRVISDQQGQSYRQLTRSGWQGGRK